MGEVPAARAGGEGDAGVGVGREEAHQLPSGVPRRPEDSDRLPTRVLPPKTPKKKPAGALAPAGLGIRSLATELDLDAPAGHTGLA